MQDAFAAVEQWPPDFQRRSVKSEWCRMQERNVGPELHVVDVVYQSANGPMANFDAFGLARGA